MPRGREPEGQIALTNAERQARYRARQSVPRPPVIRKQPRPLRRSRTKRWNDALAAMLAIQAECAAWFEALPECLRDSATAAALQEMIDLDLDSIAAVRPPLGYGRD
jgi:ferric-dicitrate binding protein FerR (iron transport regulator)